jgi:hypothetical protein
LKKEVSIMKKLIVLVLLALMLAACSDEFMKHDTLYSTNSHWAYSWWGYRSTDAQDAQRSQEQGWWGEPIPYVPAE